MTVSFTCRTHVGMEPGEIFDLARNDHAHVGSVAKSRERAVAGEAREYLACNGGPA